MKYDSMLYKFIAFHSDTHHITYCRAILACIVGTVVWSTVGGILFSMILALLTDMHILLLIEGNRLWFFAVVLGNMSVSLITLFGLPFLIQFLLDWSDKHCSTIRVTYTED